MVGVGSVVSAVIDTYFVGHAVDLAFFASRCGLFVVIDKLTAGTYVGVFA
jgi:hypothetical protein